MTLSYRTDDVGRWGSGLGRNLTPTEVDLNWWETDQRIAALEALPGAPAGIDHFEVSGTQFYVVLTDATSLGPYELPIATLVATGDYVGANPYNVLDTFTANGAAWVVNIAHTSPSVFDPTLQSGGNDVYGKLIDAPGNALPTGGATGQVLEKSSGSDFVVTWGWKTPTGGTTGQYLRQASNTQDDDEWATIEADEVHFTPVTGSTITSTNVADALEELTTGGAVQASGVEFTPAAGLTSTNVQDAIEEAVTSGGDASTTGYTPSTDASTHYDTVSTVEDALNEIATNMDPRGKQTMWIPAASLLPAVTNGPSSAQTESSSNKTNFRTLDFDASTAEIAFFEVSMPKSWDLAGLTFQAFWQHGSTATNYGVTWEFDCNDNSDTQSTDLPMTGSPVTVTDTGGNTDYLYISDETSVLSCTPSDTDNIIVVRVRRLVSDGGDNLAVDAKLRGIKVHYTTNAPTDD